VAAALEANTKLQKLDLCSNAVGTEGGTALAALLDRNTTLSKLDLRSNDLRAAYPSIRAVLERRVAEASQAQNNALAGWSFELRI